MADPYPVGCAKGCLTFISLTIGVVAVVAASIWIACHIKL